MSNTAVGQVYNRVIDAVIESSSTDFEEYGVKSEILDELRQRWQNRLTLTQRALFPWDPQPVQEPSSPAQGSNTESATEPTAEASPAVGITAHQNGDSDATIKQEQALDNTAYANVANPNHSSSGLGTQYARERAAQLLQQQFGSQASGSIGALQAAGVRQQNSGQNQDGSPSSPQTSQAKSPVKQESPAIKRENGEDGNLGQAQTDGASDATHQWEAVVVRRNACGDHEPLGRLAVDGIIRRQVEQMAQRLEGGGLMVPLDEKYPKRRTRTQRLRIPPTNKTEAGSTAETEVGFAEDKDAEVATGKGQFDGVDESEDDEDAINSDLDDPDEVNDNSIGEGVYEGDLILCLYDKVQRVKNKWKCVLKDGIVTVDGKDYVFHKASGEFEW